MRGVGRVDSSVRHPSCRHPVPSGQIPGIAGEAEGDGGKNRDREDCPWNNSALFLPSLPGPHAELGVWGRQQRRHSTFT